MYSGTTFRVKSGRLMGVHQKIDRLARRALAHSIPHKTIFPSENAILHFEGLNGPDGIKRKSPGKDEPWHYIDPANAEDEGLLRIIEDHVHNLTAALVSDNHERAAFEAAWLAHAITDGLTPAHHYPLEEKLEQMRDGKGLHTRTTAKEKLLLPGKTRREQVRNNWQFWGAKGIMTTHLAFELGVATTIAGQRISDTVPTEEDRARVLEIGVVRLFSEVVEHVAELQLYEEFYKAGWTRRLARDTKKILIPEIVRMVCLSWYYCDMKASEIRLDHHR
ncbi:hypothetical protein EON76_03645 [bacterium]|nr:MAG: hypothetical protein EON76_03645 [bacterium]